MRAEQIEPRIQGAMESGMPMKVPKRARRKHQSPGRRTASIRLPLALVEQIDMWAAKNNGQTRTGAVCELLEQSLSNAYSKNAGSRQQARAADLAASQIDRMSDATASRTEQVTRKRRLTEGPSMFRDVRRDKSRDA